MNDIGHSTARVRSSDGIVVKVLGLFSSVRLYNIVMIAIAQVFAAVFIISSSQSITSVLSDYKLWLLIVASSATIAGGYIINNFYDREKDLINRPQKTMLEQQVGSQTLWSVYFVLNVLAVVLGYIVSWKASLFFTLYILSMWLYSHKIKRGLFIGNLTAALLAISPFFVLFMYYKNFYSVILVHGFFLFLIIGMREIIKDLENLRGDLTHGYKTIPVVLGERMAKRFYTLLTIISIAPIALLIINYDIGYMGYYFAMITGALLVCLPLLWSSGRRREYLLIHFILKTIIVLGVFSILLIDLDNILIRLQNF
ncbi:MAG: geranylgeranylglycerol-phosphate geranylgeranyltransferase [Nonlabens sp.]